MCSPTQCQRCISYVPSTVLIVQQVQKNANFRNIIYFLCSYPLPLVCVSCILILALCSFLMNTSLPFFGYEKGLKLRWARHTKAKELCFHSYSAPNLELLKECPSPFVLTQVIPGKSDWSRFVLAHVIPWKQWLVPITVFSL